MLNNRNVFLIVLKVEKSKIKVLIDLVLFFTCNGLLTMSLSPHMEQGGRGRGEQCSSCLLFL